MEHDDDGFKSPERAVADLVLPTDIRPDFCAEALTPTSRGALLAATFLMLGTMLAALLGAALWSDGLGAHLSEFALVEATGLLITLTFLLLVVFGTLAGNNPRLSKLERLGWYASFAFLPPLALPAYWFIHIHHTPYQPTGLQRL